MIYEIAGLRIQIQNKYEYTSKFCVKYLSADQFSPADITVFATEEEIAKEKSLSPNFPDGYIENICLYRNICMQLPTKGRMLLHCSVLGYEDNAYAFLGKSGTGKSTHTRLWLKYLPSAKVINGDKPILEYKEGEFIVYGTPWMGKEHWGENTKAPLKGLCFLEQAKTNEIRRLSCSEAASRLFLQILLPHDEENAAAALELADKIVTEVPAYLLKCDISEEAAQKSFEALTGLAFKEKKNITD